MTQNYQLFAIDANKYLSEGDFKSAIQVCNAGLKLYPNYPTALSILIKAYYLNNEYNIAKSILDAALERYPKNLVIKNTLCWFNEKMKTADLKTANLNVNPDSVLDDLRKTTTIDPNDELFLLSKNLESAKISPVEEDEDSFEEAGDEIVLANETMAKILVKQKAYKKAIDVYNILIQKNPEKKDDFQEKIDELNSLINESMQ